MLGAGNSSRARAADHHRDLRDIFSHDFQSVQQGGAGDDGRPVLVVVEDGNRHGATQCFLDVEAFRGFDVFQVDSADGRLEQLAEADDVVGILRTYFEVEYIDIREALEEHALAFHDWLAGQSANIPQAQYRRAIRYHGNEIPFRRVVEGTLGDFLNFEAGFRHARCIGEA